MNNNTKSIRAMTNLADDVKEFPLTSEIIWYKKWKNNMHIRS